MCLILTGCAQAPRMPVDVALIPNDCANRHAIISWLENLAKTPQTIRESDQNYDQTQSAVKARIWHLRYNCQRV